MTSDTDNLEQPALALLSAFLRSQQPTGRAPVGGSNEHYGVDATRRRRTALSLETVARPVKVAHQDYRGTVRIDGKTSPV